MQADTTRYVTRSVANHLNDISKIDPELTLQTLRRWKKSSTQQRSELDFITRHSLRTLVKKGHFGALQMLGYGATALSAVLQIETQQVKVGEFLLFSFVITSQSDSPQLLMIDYNLFFQKSSGVLAPKTYKITQVCLPARETLQLHKAQPLRAMSTRKLYPGIHLVELQINGQKFGKHTFNLLH